MLSASSPSLSRLSWSVVALEDAAAVASVAEAGQAGEARKLGGKAGGVTHKQGKREKRTEEKSNERERHHSKPMMPMKSFRIFSREKIACEVG